MRNCHEIKQDTNRKEYENKHIPEPVIFTGLAFYKFFIHSFAI
jgi:hypothetical protein